MPTITIRKQLAAPPDAVWNLLADFGNVEWIPGVGEVRIEGDGPGMRRTLAGSGATPIVETLLWIKPQERMLSYDIIDNPLPVKRFVAVATVSDGAPGAAEATVVWDIDYEPDGDDDAARGAVETVYGLMAGWIQDCASSRQR